jgi:hypothetical protein
MLLLEEVIMIATTVKIILSMTPNILSTRILTRDMHKNSLRISFNGSKGLASCRSN